MDSNRMENLENASQNESQSTTHQLQQQHQQNSGTIEKSQATVKKLIKPVGTLKGLGKMSPDVLKNLKDAMKSAVAKSKGEKSATTTSTVEKVPENPKTKVKILSVENPNLNVKDLFSSLYQKKEGLDIITPKTNKLPTVPTKKDDAMSDTRVVSELKIQKPTLPVRRGASDAVKLALAKKVENRLANKKIVAAALKNKIVRPVNVSQTETQSSSNTQGIIENAEKMTPQFIVDASGALTVPITKVQSPVKVSLVSTPTKNIPSTSISHTLSPLTPSKIDINSLPVMFDDGTDLPQLIIVPPAENFQPSYVLQPTTPKPLTIKRKISFSDESEPESVRSPTVSLVVKQQRVVNLSDVSTVKRSKPDSFIQKRIDYKTDSDESDCISISPEERRGISSPSSSAKIRVPFEIEGDTKRRICLTKISTTDPKLRQNVLTGCKKLIKSTSTPFITIKEECTNSDDELYGFTSAEIEASKRMKDVHLGYLRKRSTSEVENDKSLIAIKKNESKPKIVANLKAMLKRDASLQAQLKKAVTASNNKSRRRESKDWEKSSSDEDQMNIRKSHQNEMDMRSPEKVIQSRKATPVTPSPNKNTEKHIEPPQPVLPIVKRLSRDLKFKDFGKEVKNVKKPPNLASPEKSAKITSIINNPDVSKKPDVAPSSSKVKSSLLDIREKLSQSLTYTPTASNPEIGSILELLNQDSLLNEFVKFAKEKMVVKENTPAELKDVKSVNETNQVTIEAQYPEDDDSSHEFEDNRCSTPEDVESTLPAKLDEKTNVDNVDVQEIKTSESENKMKSPTKSTIPVKQESSTSQVAIEMLLKENESLKTSSEEIKSPKKDHSSCEIVKSIDESTESVKPPINLSSRVNTFPKIIRPKKKFTPLIPKSRVSILKTNASGKTMQMPNKDTLAAKEEETEPKKLEKSLSKIGETRDSRSKSKESSKDLPKVIPENDSSKNTENSTLISSKMSENSETNTSDVLSRRKSSLKLDTHTKETQLCTSRNTSIDLTDSFVPKTPQENPNKRRVSFESPSAMKKSTPVLKKENYDLTSPVECHVTTKKDSKSNKITSVIDKLIEKPNKTSETQENRLLVEKSSKDPTSNVQGRKSIVSDKNVTKVDKNQTSNISEKQRKLLSEEKDSENPKGDVLKVDKRRTNKISEKQEERVPEKTASEKPKSDVQRRKSVAPGQKMENVDESTPKDTELKKRRKSIVPEPSEISIITTISDFDLSMEDFMRENVKSPKMVEKLENMEVDQHDKNTSANPEIVISCVTSAESEIATITTKSPEIPIVEKKVAVTPLTVPKKRGRPRKTTSIPVFDSTQSLPSTDECPVEFGLLRRKAATQADLKRRSDNRTNSHETQEDPKPKRGAKRRIVDDDESRSEDEQPLSTLKKKEPVKRKLKNEESESVKNPKKQKLSTEYTCGACDQFIERKKWIKHLCYHNGLAWRVELDEPMDLENEKNKLNIMLRYQKDHRISFFTCEKCGDQKKSALGLLSHIQKCGLSKDELDKAKIPCENCGNLVLPVSMTAHLKSHCPVLKASMMEERVKTKVVEEDQEPEFNDSGRIKRRAVKKAEALLKDEIASDFNPDEFIIVKKSHKINVRTTRKWETLLSSLGHIACYHSSDCPVVSKTIPDAIEHQSSCKFASTNYCAACPFRSNNRTEVYEHVKENHGPGDERKLFDDDDSDVYEEKSVKSESDSDSYEEEEEDSDLETPSEGEASDVEDQRKANRKRQLEEYRSQARNNEIGINPKYQMLRYMTFKELSQYKSAADSLKAFRTTHHSLAPIFPEFKARVNKIIKSSNTRLLFEPIQKTSMKFSVFPAEKYTVSPESATIDQNKWKSLALYQSTTSQDSSTIYVGGPVTSMQWLPFPDSYSGPEILVVSCKKDSSKFMSYSKIEPEASVIQLWACELSSRAKKDEKFDKVTHLYSIAIDDGPVWDMKLCPSGGYNERDRLGLLACTSVSGKVYVYALPLVKDITKGKESLLVKLVPCLILDSGLTNVFGTKISWSRHKNHSLLAAGFSNGFVCVWKLDTVSSLLRDKNNDEVILAPVHIFSAHQHSITCLVFHQSSHADYLLTGGHDRRLKVFQLYADKTSLEIFCVKCPSRVSCGEWPVNWIAFFYGIDSELTFQRGELKLKNPNELGPVADYGSLYSISSGITDVVVNEWTDVIYFASGAGEIHACYRPNYLLTTGSEKSIERYVYSYTELSKISLDPNTNEYGIVFCDLDHHYKSTQVERRSIMQVTRTEDITRPPHEKVNKLAVNPNKASFKYYAIGYESGFVRIKQNVINVGK